MRQPHLKSIGYLTTSTLVALALVMIVCAGSVDNQKSLERAQHALRSGDFDRAEQIYRELLTKDDQNKEARLGLSQVLLKERKLQDSYDHAARVVAVDPLSARAHALLGSAILASGDFRLSVEEFRTALSLNNGEAMAIAGLAMVDYYENRLGSCVAGLRRAANIDPDEPDYVFNLGQAAARSERYKEAADAYERFLEIAPRTDSDRRARIRGLIDFLRYLGAQGSLYDLGGADSTVVDFEAPDLRPIIKVRINGSKDVFRFVLDTGSGMSVLSEVTARRIGLKPVAHGGLARAVGGGGRFEIVYGYLDSIEIGEVRVTNVPVYIRHFYDEVNPVDGYLGIAVLGRLIATVDYGTRHLILARPHNNSAAASNSPAALSEAASTQPGYDIPMRTTASGFLSGEVQLEGFKKPVNFIVDTGATVTVLSEKLAAEDDAQPFLKGTLLRVFGAAGVTDNVRTALLPRLSIGNCTRERIEAAILDMEPVNETAGFLQSGILGGNFLSHYRVLFNFQRGVVRFEPLDLSTMPNSAPAPRINRL